MLELPHRLTPLHSHIYPSISLEDYLLVVFSLFINCILANPGCLTVLCSSIYMLTYYRFPHMDIYSAVNPPRHIMNNDCILTSHVPIERTM